MMITACLISFFIGVAVGGYLFNHLGYENGRIDEKIERYKEGKC